MSEEHDPLRIDDPLSRRLIIVLVVGGVLSTLVLVFALGQLFAGAS